MRVGFAWGGAEGEAFRDVLRSFSRVTGATVEPVVLPANEEQQLSSLSRSQQLDVALVSAPGIMRRLQQANDLVPIEDAETRTEIARGYDPIWRDAASVGGRPYGVLFKATEKSLMWYRTDLLARTGIVTPDLPASWSALVADARKLAQAGVPPVVIGSAASAGPGGNGWTLTDWFENVYLSVAGPNLYDRLARHELPWTDATVVSALATLADIWGDQRLVNVGMAPPGSMTYLDSLARFGGSPGVGLYYEGDFVLTDLGHGGPVAATIGTFPFPPAGALHGGVVVGGDMAVEMRAGRAATLLLRYLASPEAAAAWIGPTGNFLVSPNRLAPSRQDRRTAIVDVGSAPVVRFDMSDLAPPDFGAGSEWRDLNGFLRDLQADPAMVASIVQHYASVLETDATAAYEALPGAG